MLEWHSPTASSFLLLLLQVKVLLNEKKTKKKAKTNKETKKIPHQTAITIFPSFLFTTVCNIVYEMPHLIILFSVRKFSLKVFMVILKIIFKGRSVYLENCF